MRTRAKVWAVLAAVAFAGSAVGVAGATTEPPGTDPAGTEAAGTETTAGAAEGTEPPGTEAAAPETTEYVPPERGDADLVIWADDTRASVIRPIADEFAADEGLRVEVFEVPFDNIRDNLSTAGPAGEGPDIIIGAHDWLGELVANGSVAPIDLGDGAADYAEVAVQAFTYDGQLYGLPYAVENVALFRNTDLVPEAPATFEDLETTAMQLVADGQAEIPLGLQQPDPFHDYPLFSAFGGYVFGQNEDGTYNADDVGLDSEGALAAAQAFSDWAASGFLSGDVTSDVMVDTFSRGASPFAITGPWNVQAFQDAGVNFAVEPIPTIQGGTPAVFVGVQGFMVSAYSENQDLAKTFLVDYLNTEDVQVALFDAGGRPPAMTSAFESVSDDPIVQGFGLAGQVGQPLPAIPEMAAVWDAWTNAYILVLDGEDPTQTFTDAAESIRAAISG